VLRLKQHSFVMQACVEKNAAYERMISCLELHEYRVRRTFSHHQQLSNCGMLAFIRPGDTATACKCTPMGLHCVSSLSCCELWFQLSEKAPIVIVIGSLRVTR
jgi:hypothetical protein